MLRRTAGVSEDSSKKELEEMRQKAELAASMKDSKIAALGTEYEKSVTSYKSESEGYKKDIVTKDAEIKRYKRDIVAKDAKIAVMYKEEFKSDLSLLEKYQIIIDGLQDNIEKLDNPAEPFHVIDKSDDWGLTRWIQRKVYYIPDDSKSWGPDVVAIKDVRYIDAVSAVVESAREALLKIEEASRETAEAIFKPQPKHEESSPSVDKITSATGGDKLKVKDEKMATEFVSAT